MDKACHAIEIILTENIKEAMNQTNQNLKKKTKSKTFSSKRGDFLNTLFEPLLELQQYQKCYKALHKTIPCVLASGVIDIQLTHMIAAICHHTNRPAVILTYSELKAREIYMKIFAFS